jgi:ATP-dependent Clp protease adapter protein ClpS
MKLHELSEHEVIDRPKAPVQPKEIELDKPGGFNVCVLNDQITPAEVVVEALMAAVGLSREAAMRRMMRAHRNGWHVVATYASADVAETIADRIMAHARGNTNYDHYRTHPAIPANHPIKRHHGPWPLTAEVMEAGG